MMLEFLGDERVRAVDALHLATAIYTRDPVVRELLDAVRWPEAGSRLLDPSAGDGAVIVEALERLDLRPGADLTRVLGIEIHPDAVRQGATPC